MESTNPSSIQSFEDFFVFQEAMKLSVDVYNAMKECKDFGVRDQMRRSSLSIPSNFAEGFERDANREFIRFLYISKGSAGELRTQVKFAMSVGILSNEQGEDFIQRCKHISSMLQNLITTRRTKFLTNKLLALLHFFF